MAPSRSCPPQCRCGLAVAPSLSFVVVRPRRWLSQSNGKTSMETSRTVRGVLDATRVARGNVVTVPIRLRRALGPAQRRDWTRHCPCPVYVDNPVGVPR